MRKVEVFKKRDQGAVKQAQTGARVLDELVSPGYEPHTVALPVEHFP